MSVVKAVNLSDMIDASVNISDLPNTGSPTKSPTKLKSTLSPDKQESKLSEPPLANENSDATKMTVDLDQKRSKQKIKEIQ